MISMINAVVLKIYIKLTFSAKNIPPIYCFFLRRKSTLVNGPVFGEYYRSSIPNQVQVGSEGLFEIDLAG
jgi:hypothetical protein